MTRVPDLRRRDDTARSGPRDRLSDPTTVSTMRSHHIVCGVAGRRASARVEGRCSKQIRFWPKRLPGVAPRRFSIARDRNDGASSEMARRSPPAGPNRSPDALSSSGLRRDIAGGGVRSAPYWKSGRRVARTRPAAPVRACRRVVTKRRWGGGATKRAKPQVPPQDGAREAGGFPARPRSVAAGPYLNVEMRTHSVL